MTGTAAIDIIGLGPFALMAALAAFLITYEAYLRGKNPDRKLALRMAFWTSLAAFVFFALLIASIGFALYKIL